MRPASSRGRVLVAAVAVVALLLGAAGGYLFGALAPFASSATPSSSSAEAGFARDMQVHHLQGAELAMIARERSTDAEVLTVSKDILLTQQQQAGQLFGWLTSWGLPQAAPEPSMTWMGRPTLAGAADEHSAMGMGTEDGVVPSSMPGLATPAQITELGNTSGRAFDRMFLELMTAHHRGAIDMAEALLARSRVTVATDFATSVVKAQEAEISLMEQMLADRPAE
ncbi:DUF305 domain-containing protein [Rathayibacter tanaceti]|uniref:DUF305 domain-containing protein n=2 Tax=Rathayibacter tanaceti TaxID=1671680 RepID=A0A162F8B5_9MICO|nr:DUF305 domain-containing protein [Rathayibacter tanaceti]KZX20393.1 hypothetical protein ACH61_02499 [Rathayibacter tanaceti]QHC54827.1 DUF305 domain-containing protein [Rathayibacter tanaceti]TCO37343.1 uncharacterized protein (DUF305 family) [Rathayibacter tanaceti]